MKPTQKKHKFNAIDAAIIILIVAVISAAVFFMLSDREPSETEAKTVKIEYVVSLRTIQDEFADNFTPGDSVTDGVALYRIGEIVDTYVTDAVYNGVDLVTGESVATPYPDHSDVALTVRATATLDELGRYVVGGGFDLSVGTLICVRTPNYIGYGYCTEIRESEGGVQ